MEQYAFVPARGGILAVDGRLPRLDEIPPARFLRVAQHVDDDPPLRLRQFEAVDATGLAPEDVDVPERLRGGFEQCVAELRGAPPPPQRPPWTRVGWHEQAEAWAGMPLEQVRGGRSQPSFPTARSGSRRRCCRSSDTSPRSPRPSACRACCAATGNGAGCCSRRHGATSTTVRPSRRSRASTARGRPGSTRRSRSARTTAGARRSCRTP